MGCLGFWAGLTGADPGGGGICLGGRVGQPPPPPKGAVSDGMLLMTKAH